MMFFFLRTENVFVKFLKQLFCYCQKIGRCEVSQGIKAKKSLYEQIETTQDQRKDSLSKGSKENVVVTKKEKYIVEKREVEEEKIEGKANNEKKRNSSDSSQRGN